MFSQFSTEIKLLCQYQIIWMSLDSTIWNVSCLLHLPCLHFEVALSCLQGSQTSLSWDTLSPGGLGSALPRNCLSLGAVRCDGNAAKVVKVTPSSRGEIWGSIVLQMPCRALCARDKVGAKQPWKVYELNLHCCKARVPMWSPQCGAGHLSCLMKLYTMKTTWMVFFKRQD